MKNSNFKFAGIILLSIWFQFQLSAQAVTIYSGSNYTGNHRSFTSAGDFQITDWDVRSIRIQEGYVVQMANESGCTGICTFWRNVQGMGTVTIGARGCSIRIIQSDARNARLELKLVTGNDDLRAGSSTQFQCRISGIGIRRTRLAPAGADPGIPNGGTRTMRLDIPGVHLHQILDYMLWYRSGSSGVPFETTDNWNVNQIVISYSSNSFSQPVIVWRGNGNPLVRFTGNYNTHNMPSSNHLCN